MAHGLNRFLVFNRLPFHETLCRFQPNLFSASNSRVFLYDGRRGAADKKGGGGSAVAGKKIKVLLLALHAQLPKNDIGLFLTEIPC